MSVLLIVLVLNLVSPSFQILHLYIDNNLNSIYSAMDKLPPTIIQHIYEYGDTYRTKFDGFEANDGSLFYI